MKAKTIIIILVAVIFVFVIIPILFGILAYTFSDYSEPSKNISEEVKSDTPVIKENPKIEETPKVEEKTIELTPEQLSVNKKLAVKSLLENVGYSVIKVDEGYLESGDSYASVTMFSKGTTIEEISGQVGGGFGALYNLWKDKKWYGVALNSGINICSFVIGGNIARDFINKKINYIQLYSSIVADCKSL